ncbi:hypothetical protein NPIL_347911 [Nephila pilipes]|uniref:Uncharacterized protein n=1 Tax=Nephila pilipes TaxID=299642 RepID=A0A8X6UHM2_NEPPI|nr:hypothetical protein NPIL_347911 [Nephila pilipes]
MMKNAKKNKEKLFNELDDILSSEFGENAEDRSKDKLLLRVHKEDDSRLKAKLTSKLERYMPESYGECYPGTAEEYSEYVSNKEASP